MKIKDLKNKLENISDGLFIVFEDENGVLRKLKDISIYEEHLDSKAYIYIDRYCTSLQGTVINNGEYNHKILGYTGIDADIAEKNFKEIN